MNKQELIESISHLPSDCSRPRPMIDKLTALELIKLLDEPQKVTVPQFVGDWYEANKDDFEGNLFRCIDRMPDLFSGEELSDFEEWIVDGHTKPFQILVNMHQFGYTVEKEKRYRVSLKNGQPLLKAYSGEALYFSQDIAIENYKVTRKELEDSGFGEVFDSPLFEVEEVEE